MATKINREWHLANRMPKNLTQAQRMEWHIAHSANCNCREMTPSIKKQVAEYKSKLKA